MSPTILRDGPYREYFFSHEPNEPPHVHLDRDRLSAKFWLSPLSLSYNLGFSAQELREVERVLTEHIDQLREAWHERFGD